MGILLNIDEAYIFDKLRITPMIDQNGNKILKIYADDCIIIHPVSDNSINIYNIK